jgi:transcriptional regulator, PadR family
MAEARSRTAASTPAAPRELLRGLIQLHLLHHAAQEEIYGLAMIEELRRHGYRIGPGTLYPLLHRMTARGWLRECPGVGRQRRYRATPAGRRALAAARLQIAELFAELGPPAAS